MKAIILAAGWPGRDFPADTKPKCLYHYKGSVLLDIAVNSVLQAGIQSVRLVVGYKEDEIREYTQNKKWKLEFVRNDDWMTDAVKSLDVGLAGLDTDAMILCADLIIDKSLIEAFLKTNPDRLAWIRSIEPWDQNRGEIVYDDVYRCDIDNSIVKIPRRLLRLFEGGRERADRFLARYHWETPTGPGTGVYFGAAITETFRDHRPIEEVVIPKPIKDIDAFSQTDEFKFGRYFHDFVQGRAPAAEQQ